VSGMISGPPVSHTEPVTEILHGIAVTDAYRWLEDQNSPRTRAWIDQQTRYARSYLDNIPGREQIRKQVRKFLMVETCDSLMRASGRYFFRKRVAHREQPSLYMREGANGEDQLLLDPSDQKRGDYISVKPVRVSRDGNLLLYEEKEGGERAGKFSILDVRSRKTLPDAFPKGNLRGFVFAPDSKSFYYVFEAADSENSCQRTVYHHLIGMEFAADRPVFHHKDNEQVRLGLISGTSQFGILVYKFHTQTRTDFYLLQFAAEAEPECVVFDCADKFMPALTRSGLIAVTDRDAPNFRVVAVRLSNDGAWEWFDLIQESAGRIQQWLVANDRIVVSYMLEGRTEVRTFNFEGKQDGVLETPPDETVRLAGAAAEGDELFLQTESFNRPLATSRHCISTNERTRWPIHTPGLDSLAFAHERIFFRSKDGVEVPMFLVGKPETLSGTYRPTIMTSYGGYGISMTPQFSVLASLLMERGCLFALPNIRGGSEFGTAWHQAARRRRRQVAYDDFLSAAEWLIRTDRTARKGLAIFGGSNSGLLVAAAATQRPHLFAAVLCMVPMLDMVRYHLFDGAHVWRDEFGTSDDAEDFFALLGYSPYHNVRDGVSYPGTMIVSGDSDQNCNPLHARKMIARLQAADSSGRPILLHYSRFRGHSAVLPLTTRIEDLTDRIAFLCDRLGIAA